MDRRDFIKGMGTAGTLAAGFSALGQGLAAGPAAAESDAAAAPSLGAGGSAARGAMQGLIETLREVDQQLITPERGYTDPEEIGEAQRAVAHLLHTALAFWTEADPERPIFQPYVTPTRKLLGCNPDSIYYFAPLLDDRSYRIRGNLGAATFTSFTVERGSHDGHAAKGSIAALADDTLEVDPDGNYEILVSREEPASGNWLKLGPGASQITTRHYHESRLPIAANSQPNVPIRIEAIDPPPLSPYGGDAQIARRLERVATFVREHAVMVTTKTTPAMAKKLGWVSIEPNVFTRPGQWSAASDEIAYGNTHAYYASAPYALGPDEALVIRGRFPDCRFANVVLWNHFMQSFDYMNRRVSLNRKQIEYQKDGSFELVVAHRDPGVPNWLDTEGRANGQIYWRWVHPIEQPGRLRTRVVKHASLG